MRLWRKLAFPDERKSPFFFLCFFGFFGFFGFFSLEVLARDLVV
jgi:hypothetical protein